MPILGKEPTALEGVGGPDGRRLRQETQARSVLYEFWNVAWSTFSSPGDNFHVIESTWEAPSHLAPSHYKEALLGNLIFLITDAGFQSR